MPDPKPFLKWAGGKRRLLPAIRANLPEGWDEMLYHEPFLGGGAVLFGLRPERAVISDLNRELITTYDIVRLAPEQVADMLRHHLVRDSPEHYLSVRDNWVAAKWYSVKLSKWTCLNSYRAARFIYLNHACYNGLYRENSEGRFNVPYGRRKRLRLPSLRELEAVAAYLSEHVSLTQGDFSETLCDAGRESFAYLDPPYDGCFSGYQAGRFGPEDQARLRDACLALDRRGGKWLQSNSDTPRIRELYRDFNIVEVQAPRSISCKADGRKPIRELLIRNY